MTEASTTRKLKKTSFAIPYTQFDWGDYHADTDYLAFEEHGIYWNLLRRYYTTGPFSDDLNDLKRKMRYLEGDDNKLLVILKEFFYISEQDGCWHHKRCDEEIMKVKNISEVQSNIARKAAQSRRRDSNGKFVSENDSSIPAMASLNPANKEVIVKSQEQEEELKERTRVKRKLEKTYSHLPDEHERENLIFRELTSYMDSWRRMKLNSSPY